ncbi:MAG: SAM-dependent methyltransferase [Gammaproteobacteria bacterium]|nr:SAM-dependent methyltransferase [Gammaproteobacteria bacterium]
MTRIEDFPQPGPEAQAHSERVVEEIRRRIAAADGQLPFDEYMDAVLYAPGLGYYTAGARKFGIEGDFITAPEVSPLFSRVLAGQVEEVLQVMGSGDVLEVGAGSGVMAADILLELNARGSLPGRYFILDISADLRDRQQEKIAAAVPELLDRVEWLDDFPADFEGVVLANELLDALPVSRFRMGEDQVSEQIVHEQQGRLATGFVPAGEHLSLGVERLQSNLDIALPPGYESEMSTRLPALVGAVATAMRRGLCLFIDYGYPRPEYYHPDRRSGTLMCHYRHRAHLDVLLHPGLQDITSFVNFTAVAESGLANGLELMGFTTQAQFLLAGGIDQLLSGQEAASDEQRFALSQQAQKLVMPGEMGDRFKVMGLSRGLDPLLSGFRLKDLSASL